MYTEQCPLYLKCTIEHTLEVECTTTHCTGKVQLNSVTSVHLKICPPLLLVHPLWETHCNVDISMQVTPKQTNIFLHDDDEMILMTMIFSMMMMTATMKMMTTMKTIKGRRWVWASEHDDDVMITLLMMMVINKERKEMGLGIRAQSA